MSAKPTSAMSVSDRLVERRSYLQQFCHIEPVKQQLRLVSYYQLARQLYRQMEAYVREEAWDNAYVFLAKFVKLCSKVIPSHRDYNKPIYHKERDWISVQARSALKLFDVILDGMEASERELMEEEIENNRQIAVQVPPPAPAPPPPSAPPAELTLEDRLAALRLRRAEREAGSQSSTATSIRDGTEPKRLGASYTAAMPSTYSTVRNDVPTRLTKSSVAYPTVSKGHWMEGGSSFDAAAASLRAPRRPSSRELSKEALDQLSSGRLRSLEIPTNLISQFTAIAAPNTNVYPDGIETCGILAGKLVGSKLVITTLIVPKQEGSSDMCSMTDETELFDYCFANDLLTLGWIHTHPRQNCFLSSVDIHTQCGFQSILPEAVAIVIAPTDFRRNVGVFRLSEPDGMQLIQQCSLTGFHVHPDHIQIYSDAMACDWNPHMMPVVVDMRM